MDADGIGISRRRITLSTSGVVPFIKSVGQDLSVGLAISLHAVSIALFDTIVLCPYASSHQFATSMYSILTCF